ncbi:MAG: RidA family protein [Sneathiellales bacterium]|nr:RidA family protein [Sneathiellales bacterium]
MDKQPIIPSELQGNYDNWHFSPAVASGDFVFFSGCTGTQSDGSIASDPERQFHQAFEKVRLSLIEAGLDFSSVIEITTYHIGLSKHLDLFKSVKDKFIQEPYPAWTAIGVSEFVHPDAIVEIRVLAKK